MGRAVGHLLGAAFALAAAPAPAQQGHDSGSASVDSASVDTAYPWRQKVRYGEGRVLGCRAFRLRGGGTRRTSRSSTAAALT